MMARRGFSIMEIILALAVVAVAFMVVLSLFSSSARHAVQTRNRTMAMLLAQSLMEEVQGHTYGTAAPKAWPLDAPQTEAQTVYVDGRPQEMIFTRKMELENGSLVGKSAENFDRATIIIAWQEIETAGGPPRPLEVKATSAVWRKSLAP